MHEHCCVLSKLVLVFQNKVRVSEDKAVLDTHSLQVTAQRNSPALLISYATALLSIVVKRLFSHGLPH